MIWHDTTVAHLFVEQKPIALLNVLGANSNTIANFATTKIANITERARTRLSGRMMTMARYIDADALLKKIFPYNGLDKNTYTINAKAVEYAILSAPAKDLAPKSEVAREIFEEIQKMVNRYWLDNDYGMPDMETELTKLKKKYTEDQT